MHGMSQKRESAAYGRFQRIIRGFAAKLKASPPAAGRGNIAHRALPMNAIAWA
jgi:hypothetical protein